MSVCCQAKAARRKAKQDKRYASRIKDAGTYRAREQAWRERQREMEARRAKK